jgi:hypothetical protein
LETIRAGIRILAPMIAPALIAAAGATHLFGHVSVGLVAAAAFTLVIVLPLYAFAWIGLSLGEVGSVSPPAFPMLLATLAALVPIASASASPWGNDSVLWFYGGLAAWSIVGTCWLVKIGFAAAHDGADRVRARWPRWTLALVLGIVGFAAAVSPLPLRAGFELSRGGLESAAERVHSGELRAGTRLTLGPWSVMVEDPVESSDASFYLGSNLNEFIGIAEFPVGVSPANDDYFTWAKIDGRWWLWREVMSR